MKEKSLTPHLLTKGYRVRQKAAATAQRYQTIGAGLTQKTLSLLLSGKSRIAKKYAGKHVLVIEQEIVPLKKGEDGWMDFVKLEKKYGHLPVIVFVPRTDISYILFNLKSV